jgi:hypothetical protein
MRLQQSFIYIYLDQRKSGKFFYDGLDICFLYQPFYVGQGTKNRHKHHLSIITSPKCNRTLIEWKSNPIKCRKITEIHEQLDQFPIIQKIYFSNNRNDLNEYEENVIKSIGRICDKKGTLTNIADKASIDNSIKKNKTLEEQYGVQKAKKIKLKLSRTLKIRMNEEETNKKLRLRSNGVNNPKARKIYQYDLDNNFIREFNYINEAVSYLSLSQNSKNGIIGCARGRRKSAYGYIWKYLKD